MITQIFWFVGDEAREREREREIHYVRYVTFHVGTLRYAATSQHPSMHLSIHPCFPVSLAAPVISLVDGLLSRRTCGVPHHPGSS